MTSKTVLALVAKKSAVKRRGLMLEHLHHINVALGLKLHAGVIKNDLVLYCTDLVAQRRLLAFGAIATEYREQQIDLSLHEIEPIEIRPAFEPVFA